MEQSVIIGGENHGIPVWQSSTITSRAFQGCCPSRKLTHEAVLDSNMGMEAVPTMLFCFVFGQQKGIMRVGIWKLGSLVHNLGNVL